MFGTFKDKTIGSIHFLSPSLEIRIPPRIPPIDKKMTPAVPNMVPNCSVEYPRPPLSGVSNKKGAAILTSCDSPKRKVRMKARATPIFFFLKNEANTSRNPSGLSFMIAEEVSYFGVEKKFPAVRPNIKTAVAVMVTLQALVLSPYLFSRNPAKITMSPSPVTIAKR